MVNAGEVERGHDVLKQGEATVETHRWNLHELIRPPGHRRGCPIDLECVAALPLADIEEASGIVEVLVQPSVPPPNNTVGWK